MTIKTYGGTIVPPFAYLKKQTHIMVAGATGSGKSVLIHGLLDSLIQSNPATQLVLIDPKRVELIDYKRYHGTLFTATEPETIYKALVWTVSEMEKRYKSMSKSGMKKSPYNALWVVIDEYADLMVTDKKRVTPLIQRIAQLGRASNIHLLLATQRPTSDIITGAIKTNIDCRIALRCPTRRDSQNIINYGGAELLPRYGYGMLISPDYLQPVRISIPNHDDNRTADIIGYYNRTLYPLKRFVLKHFRHTMQ